MRKILFILCLTLFCTVSGICSADEKTDRNILTGIPTVSNNNNQRGTLLFVPLDTRPVCKNYTVESLKAAGWNVEVPSDKLLSSSEHNGNADALLDWLDKKAPKAIAIVASADSLIYGGLVDSRTHHFNEKILNGRLDRLLEIKKKNKNPYICFFVTIMRSPKQSGAPVEPAYYSTYGSQLFQQGALADKADRKMISSLEKRKLRLLNKDIPENVQKDFYGRRAENLKITEKLLRAVKNRKFDYLLIGRDDTAPFSQAHREAAVISKQVDKLPVGSVNFFAGADQLGILLLDRAVNTLSYETPFIYTYYAPGKGGQTVPSYEDETVAASAKNHILAAGGYPVDSPEKADFILAINTPENGITLSSSSTENKQPLTASGKEFLNKVAEFIKQNKKVIIADVKFGNGADNALVEEMFRQNLAFKTVSYSGWNTAGNSLGFALAQGCLAKDMSSEDRKTLLNIRYLDDWAYQANVREMIYRQLIWPKQLPNANMKPRELSTVEDMAGKMIYSFTRPYMAQTALRYMYTLPWRRMFEIEVRPFLYKS